MYFDETNNYFDIYESNVDIDNISFNRNNKLFTVEEGFNKGNMFNNLYSKYKNYVYKLKTNNKNDDLLYKLQMYTFALKDLNLYLDVHPEDETMMNEYKKVKRTLDDLKIKYQNVYGPLCSNDVTSNKWTWINNPWPWDKGGN